jgi:hypothetical protein
MVRWTETAVAWLTLAQPTAGAAEAEADADEAGGFAAAACPEAAVDADTVPHPATAAPSSPAMTIPRTWRCDIMPL